MPSSNPRSGRRAEQWLELVEGGGCWEPGRLASNPRSWRQVLRVVGSGGGGGFSLPTTGFLENWKPQPLPSGLGRSDQGGDKVREGACKPTPPPLSHTGFRPALPQP